MYRLKILLATSLIASSFIVIAQSQKKVVVEEAYVSGILKTLAADDMQGRKVFTPGIEKAGTFIQQEFKQIGLQYYPGLKSYRQEFLVYQMVPVSRQVFVNGKAIAPTGLAIAANSAFTELTWSSTQKKQPSILYIRANQDFVHIADSIAERQKANDGIRERLQDLIVFVDTIHAPKFNRMKPSLEKFSSKILKGSSSILFVLSGQKQVKSYQITVRNTIKEQKLYNVIGMLPGKSRKQEIVMFSGHYDHMGIVDQVDGKMVNGDSIMNGANDDASGTTAVMALAKYFKALKNNERTLLFVAFTFEERGGYGSKFFANSINPAEIITMFNIEMIGRPNSDRKNEGGIIGGGFSNVAQLVNQNLQGHPFSFSSDKKQDDLFYRSDNIRLARLGVPAHTFVGGEDPFYHTVDDEFESIDIPYMTKLIEAIAIGSKQIVAGQVTPTRLKMSLFK